MSAQILTLLAVCDSLTDYTNRLAKATVKPEADWSNVIDQLLDVRGVLMRERDTLRPSPTLKLTNKKP